MAWWASTRRHGISELRRVILASAGPSVRDWLEGQFAPVNIFVLTIRQILEAITLQYGTPTQREIDEWQLRLRDPLLVLADLEAHQAIFRKTLRKLPIVYRPTANQLFQQYLATLGGFPTCAASLSTFYSTNPDVNAHTIANVMPFLVTQLPFLTAAQGTTPHFSGSASNPPAPKPAKAKRDRTRRKQKPVKWNRNAAQGASSSATDPFVGTPLYQHMLGAIQHRDALLSGFGGPPPQPPAFGQQLVAGANQVSSSSQPPLLPGHRQGQGGWGPPREHYCFQHGYNNSHDGPDCNVMADNPNYTDADRAATSHHSSGGNPNVGPPVTGTSTPFPPPPPPVLYGGRRVWALSRWERELLGISPPVRRDPPNSPPISPAPPQLGHPVSSNDVDDDKKDEAPQQPVVAADSTPLF